MEHIMHKTTRKKIIKKIVGNPKKKKPSKPKRGQRTGTSKKKQSKR